MEIKMLESQRGAVDGHTVKTYEKGKIYDLEGEMAEELYRIFVEIDKVAVDYVEPELPKEVQEVVQKKMLKRTPKNKAIETAPSNKKMGQEKFAESDLVGKKSSELREIAKKIGVDLADLSYNTSATNVMKAILNRQK